MSQPETFEDLPADADLLFRGPRKRHPQRVADPLREENADPDVTADCLMALDRIVSRDWPYQHSEGNSTAHVKSVLTGVSVTLPVSDGRLALGTWQGIYLYEHRLRGQRREVVLHLIGE